MGRFSELSVAQPSRNYIIFSTVLNKDGRPSLWQGEAKVPAWSEVSAPEHMNYDVQVQFMNYSRINDRPVTTGVITWNHTGGKSPFCYK